MVSPRAERFAIDYSTMPDRVKDMMYQKLLKLSEDNNPELIFLVLDRIRTLSECESPIEKILLYSLIEEAENLWIGFEYKPQQTIKANNHKYRADIVFDMDFYSSGKPYKLVIECDGHEFHEVTKEQVEKRNIRDMDLKIQGYDVLHYSGSQICKNPKQCARDITQYIMLKVREKAHG